MRIRSITALVMPMTLIGLHALSVEMPTTVSTRELAAIVARTSSSAPMTFVRTASTGKYSQVGTCFSAAAWMTTSAPRTASTSVVVVADVADTKPQQRLTACSVDDFVGRRPPVQEAQAHFVLLGFVARQHRHPGRTPQAAVEQAADDPLPQRTRPPRHQYPLVV